MLYIIFTNVLNKKQKLDVDLAESSEQGGFRRGISIMNHIQTEKERIEINKEYKLTLCFFFIAYAKALQSSYTGLWRATLLRNNA